MIIVDIDMPESCKKCQFRLELGCDLKDQNSYCSMIHKGSDAITLIKNINIETEKPDWCPIKAEVNLTNDQINKYISDLGDMSAHMPSDKCFDWINSCANIIALLSEFKTKESNIKEDQAKMVEDFKKFLETNF